MKERIQGAFDEIHAEEALKEKTRVWLAEQTGGYGERRRAAPRAFRRTACAAACLLLLAGGGWLYFVPTAEIAIDINPSIELGVNRFDTVVSVNGVNDDGKALAATLGVRFHSYTDALRQILDSESVAALLARDEELSIAVIGADGKQCERMLSGVEGCASGHGNAHCYSGHAEEAAAARALGLPYGKYQAFLELQALDPSFTPEQAQGMTLRELRERLAELAAGSGETADAVGTAQPGAHHGGGRHGGGMGYGHGRHAGWAE